MKTIISVSILIGILLGLMAFNTKINSGFHLEKLHYNLTSDVINKEKQALLNTSDIVNALKEGNERFANNAALNYNYPSQISKSKNQQFPKAFVLSCTDSRVPVERVFDRSIGDLQVGRVAGNLINKDILGSMEYACKVAGAKVIVVLGHENCTAIHSAIDGVNIGNISNLTSKIEPVISNSTFKGSNSTSNINYVNHISEANIHHTIEQIKINSEIINQMVLDNEVEIVPAIYQMETGIVKFL